MVINVLSMWLLKLLASSQVLNLSYNYLSTDDIVSIGRLPRLKVLHLTGNQLHHLPPNLGAFSQDTTQLLVKYIGEI